MRARNLRSVSSKWWALLTLGLVVGTILWVAIPFSPSRIRAPRPEVTAETEPVFELPSSVLTVPIRIELAALLEEVEEEIPVEWGSLDDWHELNDRAQIAVHLERTPFAGSFEGSTARLSATIAYRVRGRYDLPALPDPNVSCGTGDDEPRPRIDVTLEGPLTIAPDWRLAATTHIGHLAPTTDSERDECDITFMDINVTDRVVEMARSFLEEHRTTIDSLIAEADIRDEFEEWWAVLKEPIELDDEVWLDMRPSAISRGTAMGDGRLIEVPATLTAQPRIVLGPRPIPWPQDLPPLGVGTSTGGLHILLEGTADYRSVSARLTEALGGSSFRTSGRRLSIGSIEVTGIGGGRLALAAEIEGDLPGRIFFVGTPDYDEETGFVSVPDLTLDVSSSNLLVAGASWIGELGLEVALRERARWRVDSAIGFGAERLHDGLNRELTGGVTLEGTVDRDNIRILGVLARLDRLVVWAEARADARLLVDESA